MHSTKVSKNCLAVGWLSRYDSASANSPCSLWTEPARFAVPMISTVAPSAIADCIMTVNAQMTWPTPALCASGARYSSGKRLLVVIGENLDIKRCADSTLPVPADGAGGLRLR